MEALLRQSLHDPTSYWGGVPKDILGLVLLLYDGALMNFRGELIAVQRVNMSTWTYSSALKGLHISPTTSVLAFAYQSSIHFYQVNGRQVGHHRLKEKYRGDIKVTKDKVIYYSRKWIYHVSHDFKRRQKYLCPIDQLAGSTFCTIYPHFVLCGTNVLLTRSRHDTPAQIELCYLTVSQNQYSCHILASLTPVGHQLLLNKHFALAVTYSNKVKIEYLHAYDFRRNYLSRQVLDLPPLVMVRKLIGHRLILSSDESNVIFIYNLLSQQIEKTIALTGETFFWNGARQPIDYRYKYINKQNQQYQILMYSPYTHHEGYQVFM